MRLRKKRRYQSLPSPKCFVNRVNFCSYSRDFPSNFLSLGSFPPRSCSSGLGFRIIAAPRGLSPQYVYRVGRTQKTAVPKEEQRLVS